MPEMQSSAAAKAPEQRYAWYRELTRYHWFVLAVASLGWMFDTMAQQLFNIARVPAIRDLLGAKPGDAVMARVVSEQAGYATMVLMIGWAIGGVLFGILGDRIGRAKTMMMTILFYSLFTGLSVLSSSVWRFQRLPFPLRSGGRRPVRRGCGAGGRSDAGTRPPVRSGYGAGPLRGGQYDGRGGRHRPGADGASRRDHRRLALRCSSPAPLPAPLALVVFKKLKEPEQWLKARAEKKKDGIVRRPVRRPALAAQSIVGMLLAFAGVVGLWGIGFFSFDLFRPVLEKTFTAQGYTGAALAGKTTIWIGITRCCRTSAPSSASTPSPISPQYTGRKKAFAISFLAAMGITAFTFWNLQTFTDILWMIPLMGFCQLALFGGYAIYLPELFPTRLRSTGTSFCYNVGRLVAAAGPLTLGLLTSRVYAGYDEPMRYAGVTMCLVFLVGLAALPFAPETKGKPLPE